jgi:hypothetical protein
MKLERFVYKLFKGAFSALLAPPRRPRKKSRRRSPARRSPQQAAWKQGRTKFAASPGTALQTVLAHYEELDERAIADVEHGLLPYLKLETDRSLLYALRLSKCVPTLKVVKTLISRWNTTNCGAGGFGLEYGKQSRHYKAVFDFLASRYLQRLHELLVVEIDKADATAQLRKTASAKRNVWLRLVQKLERYERELLYDLPGFTGVVRPLIDAANAKAST